MFLDSDSGSGQTPAMTPARYLLAGILLSPVATAVGQDSTREANALRDAARTQERQARALEHLQRQLRDQAVRDDRAQRNAERDSRSSRRFNWP